MFSLFTLVALWIILTPILILGKMGNMENRLTKSMEDGFAKNEKQLMQQLNVMRVEISRLKEPVHSPQRATSPPVDSFSQEEKAEAATRMAYGMPTDCSAVSIPEASPVPPLKSNVFAPVEAVSVETAPEAEHIPARSSKVESKNEVLAVFKDGFLEKTDSRGSEDFVTPKPISKVEHEHKREEPEYKRWRLEEAKPQHFDRQAAASKAQEPGILEDTFRKFWSWLLTEGNIWVCAGIILVLVGFGLLFNYAIQRGFLTMEMRLAGAALTGIVMTGFGFMLRERRRTFGLILQGGGMGILYLVIFAATKYNLLSTGQPILPPTFAIVAMLVLSVFTVLLALLQDYQPLAIFAILGGFAAPILISTGSHDHVTLFSIYTLLNLEILALTLKRDWRLLSRMGFIFTASIGVLWGMENWRLELFYSVEPFLVIFLVTYTLIALVAGNSKTRAPDLLLGVGAPFMFFALQMHVVEHFKYGMALTCLGLGIWHLLLGIWLRGRDENEYQKKRLALSRLYMFLCLLFSNLVIPYTFDSTVSSAIWAIEGAFLVVAACRIGSYKALLAGIALHAGALLIYWYDLPALNWNAGARLSPILVSGILFALSFLCSSFWATRFHPATDGLLYDKWEEGMKKTLGDGSWVRNSLSWVFSILGALWLWYTFYDQAPRLGVAWFSVFTVSCFAALVGSWMTVNLNWKAARFLLCCPIVCAFADTVAASIGTLSGYPVYGIISFLGYNTIQHIQIDAFVYLVFVGSALYVLREAETTITSPLTLFSALVSGLYLVEKALLQLGMRFNIGEYWALLFSVLPLFVFLLCLQQMQSAQKLQTKKVTSSIAFATGLILFFRGWFFIASFYSPGSVTFKETYIPFLNPLELWQAAFMFSVILWAKVFIAGGDSFRKWPTLLQCGATALFFIWFNQVAVRASWYYWAKTLHYDFWSVFHSAHCQAVIAIFWGVLGLLAILYGQKTRSRILWYAGAALLAADMIKLLLIDLSSAATLVRIVAFLVMGGLLILIGWVAPLPPKKENEEEE
jgi:uncharacterized membrane protein